MVAITAAFRRLPASARRAAFVGVHAILLGGCATATAPAPQQGAAIATPPAAPAVAPAPRAPQGSLVAIVDGESIEFNALREPLVELAGQTALRDAVLDTRLAKRLKESGIKIDDAAIERERKLLLDTLSEDPARAVELLGEIRSRQGLGKTRFAQLMKRNAGLRALVASAVKIDDAGIANAFDMLHGPKRVARLAVLSSLPDAEKFARDLAQRPFADLAVERSLDESAVRGGLLAPIARRDPSYPEPIRVGLYATAVGSVSTPVLDGGRFYLLQVLEEKPADGVTLDASRTRCEAMVRLSRERLLMEALARELSSLERVTVFDRAFDGAPAPTPPRSSR